MSLKQDLKNHYAIFVVAGGFLIIMLIAIAFKGYGLKIIPPSAPAMPEVKSESVIKSPVLEETLRLQEEWDKVRILLGKLQQKDIEVLVSIESKKAEVFLEQLLADEDSQKTFRYFSKRKIIIYLSTRYRVSEGCVYINSADGVKKTAKWLATGKM